MRDPAGGARRGLWAGVGLLCALAVAAALVVVSLDLGLVLTREDIQQALDPRFPVVEETRFLDLHLREPRVSLEEGTDRIGLEIDVLVAVHPVDLPLGRRFDGAEIRGGIGTTGALRYEASEGAFYLAEPRIETLTVEGLADEHVERVRGLAERALGALLAVRPVYRFREDELGERATRVVLRSAVVRNGGLHVELGLPE